MFEAKVQENPEKIAVTFRDEQLTYHQLNEKSNQLAETLRLRGIRPDQIVGLMVERSFAMIIGILGILKAGGAYLPIDIALPLERKRFMLEDAGVEILLTQRQLIDTLNLANLEVLDLNDKITYKSDRKGNQLSIAKSENLAYIMYTSGSTGQPKGVMVKHQGVVRLLFNTTYIQLSDNERIMQIAPYSFDASTFEIWASLLMGGTLILISKDKILSIKKLSKAIKDEKITTCWLTSSLFNRVIDEAPEGLSKLKNLLVGGEALSVPHISKALKSLPDTTLINGYVNGEYNIYLLLSD